MAAAAAVLAGVTLTACQPVKLGAAATVGDQRITVSQLESVVDDWQREFAANPDAGQLQQRLQQQGQQIPFDPDSPIRSALYQLIEIRVWDQVAKDKNITVGRGQVDEMIARNGGDRVIHANLLAGSLPVRYSRDFVRSGLILQAVAQQAGATVGAQPQANQQQQQEALRRLQETYLSAAKTLKIKINPRYGSFDPRQGGIAPMVHTLSKNGTDIR
ncbi:SurA N-terminal domain-containing protein [Actinomadura sp. HBU206391]|uniref:SurA N-terminal domain-containing protein n=1 Tax=Actinomadura sp. HBU206391 TaxID=2731692 RepID=UPI0016505DD5|nr:SurA N-terminal domain-containing protein [Actinomadura sp. HBU206391]MBC6459058.1 SurA N-terminal domain-containing protein [Actinomadura sp. HBU206391]